MVEGDIHIAAANCCGCPLHGTGTQMVGPRANPAAGAMQTSRPLPTFGDGSRASAPGWFAAIRNLASANDTFHYRWV